MKKILLVLVLLIGLSSCTNVKFLQVIYGKSKNWSVINTSAVPHAVIVSFEKKYPGITSVIWQHPVKNKYVANFTSNGKITLVVFTPAGVAKDEENYEPEDYYYDDEYDDYWDSDR